MKRPLAPARRLLAAVLLAPIRLYQRFISPALPARCKYYPTCSDYALHAVRELGPLRGALLAAWRLARCNPWSHGGYDPVEDRPFFRAPTDRPARDRRHEAPAQPDSRQSPVARGGTRTESGSPA